MSTNGLSADQIHEMSSKLEANGLVVMDRSDIEDAMEELRHMEFHMGSRWPFRTTVDELINTFFEALGEPGAGD